MDRNMLCEITGGHPDGRCDIVGDGLKSTLVQHLLERLVLNRYQPNPRAFSPFDPAAF